MLLTIYWPSDLLYFELHFRAITFSFQCLGVVSVVVVHVYHEEIF